MPRALTPEQQAVVDYAGSAAVTAGAGTGKTELMAERFAAHLTRDGLRPLQVVAVTFTDAAAAELRSRIRRNLAGRPAGREEQLAELEAAPIGTLHSLCKRICDEHPGAAEVAPGSRVLDQGEAAAWLAEHLDDALSTAGAAQFGRDGVPFSLAREALGVFLDDPLTAAQALGQIPAARDEWLDRCQALFAEEVRRLTEQAAWRHAVALLDRESGPDGDSLEANRRAALAAVGQLSADPCGGLDALAALNLRSKGSAASWSDVEAMREAVSHLANQAREFRKRLIFRRDEAEERQHQILCSLRALWEAVQAQLDEAKRIEGVLTFADLETGALRALRCDSVRKWYGARWRALIVDECQDLNPAQEELLTALVAASPAASVTLVGDEKQSIYGFRGADPGLFARLRQRLVLDRGGKPFRLSHSFRTHAALMEQIVNPAFVAVLDGYEGLTAERVEAPFDGPCLELAVVAEGEGAPVQARRRAEAEVIADRVEAWLAEPLQVWDKESGGRRAVTQGDIAVLSRTWDPLDLYGEALAARGIAVAHAGGAGLLQTREAQDAAALLRFLATEADDPALAAVLRSPFCAVDDRTLLRLARRVRAQREEQARNATGVGAGLAPPAAPAEGAGDEATRATQGSPLHPEPSSRASWWAVLGHEAAALGLEPLHAILAELLEAARREPPSRLLARADELTGYTAVLANLPLADRRLADWEGFAGWVREAERGHEDVFVLTRQLRRAEQLGIDVPRPVLEARDAVALLTIHHAKGLEWPVVIVPDLARQPAGGSGKVLLDRKLGAAVRFRLHDPADDAKPFLHGWLERRRIERERAEARRVAYVALTRARDRVLLTSPGEAGGGEAACLLAVLRPGLEQLGLAEGDGLPGVTARLRGEVVAYSDARALPKQPALPAIAEAEPGRELLPAISARRLRLPVTALDEYRQCPRRFQLRHLEGHPGDAGLSGETDPEEPGGAAELGTLVHLAIERGAETPAAVRALAARQVPSLSAAQVDQAAAMVLRFLDDPEFAPVRGDGDRLEHPIRVTRGSFVFLGRVDRLGDGYVVDYKTGEHTVLAHHLAQLRLYLEATGAERAYVADLRRGGLLAMDDVAAAEAEVARACASILAGEFPARPAKSRCKWCPYRRHAICTESAWPQPPLDESTLELDSA